MQREAITPRQDWEDLHLRFRFGQGTTLPQPASWVESENWNEDACYQLTAREANIIAVATNTLHDLYMTTIDRVITSGNYGPELCIPDVAIPAIERSWKRRDPMIFGRFDLAFDGVNPPKLLEYNADYACQLLESSVLQYHWACANQKPSQFNNIHGELVAQWHKAQDRLGIQTLHMTADLAEPECVQTVDYMKQAAEAAGLTVKLVDIARIDWDNTKKVFFDMNDDQDIHTLFKLAPWATMAKDAFGTYLLSDPDPMQVIEPAYKMLMDSKAFMALLWKENPGHDNLLPTYRTVSPFGNTFVRKPVWGSMGDGVTIAINDAAACQQAIRDRNNNADIFQKYQPLPVFNGHSALTCSWVVGDVPAGIGIREQKGNIVDGKSIFVPHYLK